MNAILRTVAAGAAAGAAGTTVLNAITYLDMAVRARPASSTPEESARRLARAVGMHIPGDEEQQQNRAAGIGPLLGLAAGVGTGVLAAGARALGWRPGRAVGIAATTGVVLLAANAPMTVLKVTDPRTWSAADWASDILPHLGYAIAADAVLRALEP
ncbi:hypothetical protein [Sinomonas terrae]|uniref:DUF1440 domain-containing protein n=1 Tax=Sinomonas terrae TaxID=2908838 RepID=A0ABS9U2B1_9MICC|nr:hypothetical protein [Sinomonas terrae]MCH6470410.1 hypothetical protein [Sinomonas terrae]